MYRERLTLAPQALTTEAKLSALSGCRASNKNRGFYMTAEPFPPYEYRGASVTIPQGISNGGQIVGLFSNSSNGGQSQGFIYDNGNFSTIGPLPGAIAIDISGINDAGLFVGSSIVQAPGFPGLPGHFHGFLDPPSEVPEPASLLLLASGLGSLAVFRKRWGNGGRTPKTLKAVRGAHATRKIVKPSAQHAGGTRA